MIENISQEYIAEKDTRIGVTVIINGKDTVSINDDRDFPVMNVVKFLLTLTIAHRIDNNDMSLNDSIAFGKNDLDEDTYSPIFKMHGKSRNATAVGELSEWSLVRSDNSAADTLLKRTDGTSGATLLMRQLSISDKILIDVSEEDMHRDPYLSYLNHTTPLAMAQFFDRSCIEIRNTSQSYSEISSMFEQCSTGRDRLAVPLLPTNATIGHKTSTGLPTPDGRISAVNGCGYVRLPDGTRYSIVMFVADFSYNVGATSVIITEISNIAWKSLTEHRNK